MPHSPADSSADSDILDLETAPSSASTTTTRYIDAPSSTFSPSARGATVVHRGSQAGDKDVNPISPALSGFSFNIDPEPTSPPSDRYPELSFRPASPKAASRPPTRGDYSMADEPLTRTESASKRVQYFEDSFDNDKSSSKTSAKERIQRDSPIIVELRTNVIIKDEYTVVTNLSQHISERYRRPESAIVLNVNHSGCLIMGGSFEPAYILTISAIPSEVQPVTNKRNAYLIQCFIADILSVPSDRGVVRFLEIAEENLATNGSTVAGEIDRLDRSMAAVKGEAKGSLVRSLTGKSSRRSLIPDRTKTLVGVGERKESTDGYTSTARRKSLIRGGSSLSKDSGDPVGHPIERNISSRSLRSMKSFKARISPPLPTELVPAELPSPKSISDFSQLPKIHRLSPLHGMQFSAAAHPSPLGTSSTPASPTSASAPTLPPFAPTFDHHRDRNDKEAILTSHERKPSMKEIVRPQSARRHLSNITGPAEAIPSPPPIPVDIEPRVSPKLSKRKSFVSMFRKADGVVRV